MRKINTKIPSQSDTGFGTNSNSSGGRFVQKSGKPNIVIKGIPLFSRFSAFHTMLLMPAWKFLLIIIGYYVSINIVFACIYLLIGIENLNGITPGNSLANFGEAFFFSAQTFTTVGYGRISPVGFITSSLAAFEAMIGLLTFAIATGLFYGRFSQPKAFMKFSENMIIAPYKDITALMFRMAPHKNNDLTEVEVKLTLALRIEEDGRRVNRFYQLELELSKVNALSLSWTVVHPITENSPFYHLSLDEIKALEPEILVFVRAFDEGYSNIVVARTSYIGDEFVYGVKFVPMYHPSDDGKSTVLDVDRLNVFEPVPMPVTVSPQPVQ
jgi:inward rectifier potassium channel